MGRFTPRSPAELEATAASVLGGAREHVDVAIPGTEVTGRMRGTTRSGSLPVKAGALAAFKERGLVNSDGTITAVAVEDWRCEVAARHLAVAVREHDDGDPLAPLDDWRELTDEQISGPWDRYQ